MVIAEIQLKNFASYQGEHTIKLKPGLTVIVGENRDEVTTADSNGSGKTNLVNAIPWALYGGTPSGLKGKEAINRYADSCKVRVTFSNGLIVERAQGKKHSLQVIDNGELWAGDVAYIQGKLDEMMGVGLKLFGATVYLGNNAQSAAFLRAIPSARAALMADLVDDGLFQTAANLVAIERKNVEGEITAMGYRRDQSRNWVEKLTYDIERMSAQISNAEAQDAIKRQDLRERIANCNTFLTQAQLTLLKPPISSMKELESSRSTYSLRLTEIESQLRETGFASMPSLGVGEACPTCLSPFTKVAEERCREHVKKIKDLRNVLNQESASIKRAITVIEGKQNEVRNLEQEKIRAKREFEFYQKELGHLEDELNSMISSSTQALIENRASAKKRLTTHQKELNEFSDRILTMTNRLAMLRTIQTGFSTDIRNYLFDEIRGKLAFFSKIYLHELAGGAVSVEYPTTSKALKEKFEIILQMHGKDQELHLYSTGEAWRASFAILLALRDTMLQISKSKIGFLVVDDPVGTLCKTGKQNFSRILRKLTDSNRVPQVFATVPEDGAIDSYDTMIKVMKSSHCSRIVS